MSRSLLLKGLGGVGVIAGAGSLVVFREKIFGVGEEGENLSEFKHKELIEKVGLNCGLGVGVDEVTETKVCSVKDNGTINVEVEGKKEEGVSFTVNTSKLKVSKDEKYSGKLKFVVDSGDLALTKGEGAATTIQKLEQFETYEVKKVREKFYLKRKTEAKKEKGRVLGLEDCGLPDTGTSECSLDTKEKIKKVKFEGHDGGVEVSSGTVTLKISRVDDSIKDFTDNYRFTFTFPQEITINSKNLKANTPYDFKIKKHDNSNNLTLEQAWTADNDFAKKAGLSCTNNECSVASEPKLNVKVGDKKKEGITGKTGTGKIKMEAEQPRYNQGLKFSITTGDVTWTSSEGDTITKLEELETYEITEEGGKFYLSIKTSKKDAIESSLSIPERCFKTLNTPCTLTSDEFKKINFEGKSSPSATGTVNLTISEATNTTDFPLGYKFTFETTADATITAGNTPKSIKAKIPTDFKIKKGAGNALSLEKAWTATTLGAKVGFQNCNTNKNECTINAGNLNVKQSDKSDTGLSKSDSGDAKIKVKKDQEGYNQGFKFTIEGGNISLSGGTKTDDNDKIKSLDEFETYEVKEEGNNWYLARKNEAIVYLKKALGFEFCSGDSFGGIFDCNITDVENLKNIKFEGKDSHRSWPTGAIKIQMTIEKDTRNNNELKFTFNKKDDSDDARGNVNSSSLCLPYGSGGSIDLKQENSNAEYQIKKSGSSLSLVKKS